MPANATGQQPGGGMGLGGGGLGSMVATGMALGVGSSIGHAAAGAAMGALSGDGDDGVGVYEEYEDGGAYDSRSMAQNENEHPCMKYWEQFQSCINMNANDVGGCQKMYDVFNRCQTNPDGFI